MEHLGIGFNRSGGCAASLYGRSFSAKNSLRRSSASLCQFSSSQGCVAYKVLMNVNDTVDGRNPANQLIYR